MTREEYINYVMKNELRNREPDIYDIEDAYMEGYKEAYTTAVKLLKTNSLLNCEDIVEFEKTMKL